MSRAEDFKNLAEDILSSFNARVNFIGQNVLDTHEFLDNAKKARQKMAKHLKSDLGNFVCDLTGSVEDLREKFQGENKKRAQAAKEPHRAWEKVTEAMAKIRRTNRFKGAGK